MIWVKSEIYTIIDGVENGLGRAVVPVHLIKDNKKIRIVDGLKPLRTPVYLIYFKQEFYPKLRTETLHLLNDFNN